MMLSIVPLPYRLLALAALAAACAFFGYTKGMEHVQAKWDAANLKQEILNVKAVSDAAQHIQEAHVQHAKDQTSINALHDRLARGLPVHVPTVECVSGVAQTGTRSDEAGRVFQQRVDESFARFRQRLVELAGEADQLNIDAAEVK